MRRLVFALLAVAAAALLAHSLVFNFVTDDAFISFVYARNFAEHGQLVFNLGERAVEGYTNFLWTVLLAGLMKLGWLPEHSSRVLGTAFAIASFGALAWLMRRARRAQEWSPWDALPALFLAACPGYACWSSGGLETQMFTFLVTLGAAFYLDESLADSAPSLRSAVAFGVAALTRPEGALFFAITIAHYAGTSLARRRFSLRAGLLGLGAFALIVLPHFVWRRWYYGWWLPNTFYIKSSGIGGTWQQGGYYLWRVVEQFHLWTVALLVVPALVINTGLPLATNSREAPRLAPLASPIDRTLRPVVGYACLVVGLFAIYVASVGGDFMGLYRFVIPAMPMVALVAALCVRALLCRVQPLPATAAVVVLLGLHVWHAARVDELANVTGPIPSDRGIDTPGYLRWYTADRIAVGKWFAQYARPDDYAAVGGAGAQVYYSRIRSLDCYGLSDEHVAHRVPAHSSRPGHQKYAPDAYILSKHPTIITSYNYRFVYAPYVGGDAAMWMQRGYHYVTVPVSGASTPMYSFLLRNDCSFGPLPRLGEPSGEP